MKAARFDETDRILTIAVDFRRGSRFDVACVDGGHPCIRRCASATGISTSSSTFFQHACYLDVRVPRVRLPDGGNRQVDPPWAGSSPASRCGSRR